MKLKEKFENIILDNNELIPAVNQCEKVANNLAIDFSAWLFTRTDINLKNKNLNELLEIFKKENSL